MGNLDKYSKDIDKNNQLDNGELKLSSTIEKLFEILKSGKENNGVENFLSQLNGISEITNGKETYKICENILGYKTDDNKIKLLHITDDLKIVKLSFEFDDLIEPIDNGNNLFIGSINGEVSIFVFDYKDQILSYIYRNNHITKAKSTYKDDLIIIEHNNGGIKTESIYKYKNNELICILDDGSIDIDIEVNSLVSGRNIVRQTNFIGTIEDNDFILLKEFEITDSCIYQNVYDEFDQNSKSYIEVTKNNGVNLNSYIYDYENHNLEVIKNFYILGVNISEYLSDEEIIKFLEGKALICIKDKIFKFDPKENIVILLKKFDKKSEIISLKGKIYTPKKGYCFIKGIIYKKGLLKNQEIKKIETESNDLNIFFDEISL